MLSYGATGRKVVAQIKKKSSIHRKQGLRTAHVESGNAISLPELSKLKLRYETGCRLLVLITGLDDILFQGKDFLHLKTLLRPLARFASSKIVFLCVVVAPFGGKSGDRIDRVKFEDLRSSCNGLVIATGKRGRDAAAAAAELVSLVARSLSETGRTAVQFTMSDFAAFFKENGRRAFFGFGESRAKGTAVTTAMKSAIAMHRLKSPRKKVRGTLLNVCVGPERTLEELSCALAVAESEFGGSAQMVWGVSVEPKLKNQVRVSALWSE